MLSIEGLLLKTNRFEIAKDVILTYCNSCKNGLIPNGFSEENDEPLYNSVDSGLLLFEVIYKYIEYTNDYDFIFDNVFDILKEIIGNYEYGTINDIYLSEDALISAGNSETQLTWMDAKVNDRPITPRFGKVVEINALWFNALNILSKLCDIKGEDKRHYMNLANKCKKSFVSKFYYYSKKYLLDTLSDNKIRPNALFATCLSFPIIEGSIANEIINTAKDKLLTNRGMKTLLAGENGYGPRYEGNASYRDSFYHQGTVWPWLWGIYFDSLVNLYKLEKNENKKEIYKHDIKDFQRFVEQNVKIQMEEKCIYQISEVYDAEEPRYAKGCFAQAWSLAQIIKILDTKI